MGDGTARRPLSAVRIGLLVAGCWLLACGFAPAAEERSPVAVEMSAAPAQVAMGGSITLTIRYRWPRGWRIPGEPNPTLDFAEQFVTAAPPPTTTRADGEERRVFTLTVCPTRSGAWELPCPGFAAAPPQGEPVRAQASPVIIQVGVADKPIEPPPARPLVQRPPAEAAAHRRAAWIAAGVVALAALAAILALRARRQALAAAPTPREALARELAAAAQTADGKEAGSLISLALRRFAGAIWGFDGPGSTAREATAAARARGPDDEARELSRLLENLDALRWSPDELVAGALAPLIEGGARWGDAVQRRLDAEREARERDKRARASAAPTAAPGAAR